MAGGRGIDGCELLGDWGGPSPPSIVSSSPLPSPRSLFPSLMLRNASFSTGQSIGGEEEKAKSGGEEVAAGVGVDGTSGCNGGRDFLAASRRGGSIAERRAASSGFNAARLNTARFRTASPLPSPAVRSPYLTIPPGLSPTTLLDSPVMLLNSLSQPSPTTGSFPDPSILDQSPSSVLASDENKDEQVADIESSSFVFKPHIDASIMCTINIQDQVSPNSTDIVQHMDMVDDTCQSQGKIQLEVGVENQAAIAEKESTNDSVSSMEAYTSAISNANFMAFKPQPVGVGNEEEASQCEGKQHVDDSSTQLLLDGDLKESFPPAGLGRPSEDGYNWRKYGQKQVKGSEYPRSYYKCTHPTCQVKKKVERSHDGQITEIIYKGSHNHLKPQPNRRSAVTSAFALNEMSERPEGAGSLGKFEGCSAWRSFQQQGTLKDISDADRRGDGIERTSTSGVTDISDPSSTARAKHKLELADTPELSSTMASDEVEEDEEDRATQGSISIGDDDDDDDDESESKRRKKDSSIIEANLSSRAVREPRVVVQTTSEVDILDDGYRWRKYGQKVVKGNPNPRSYYKCTNPGCSVRKHVERASHDIKSVITTYEGKHNHEVPAARNSSHGSSASGNLGPSSGAAESSLLPTIPGISNSHARLVDFAPCFKPNEYLKAAAYLRTLSGDIKPGVAPCFDMKLYSLQPVPCAPFGMSTSNINSHPLVSLAQTATNLAGPLPMGVQGVGNLALPACFSFNPGKVMEMQPYLGQQQSREGEIRLLNPKEEQKDDTPYEGGFDMSHPPNPASMYNQIMGRFPV